MVSRQQQLLTLVHGHGSCQARLWFLEKGGQGCKHGIEIWLLWCQGKAEHPQSSFNTRLCVLSLGCDLAAPCVQQHHGAPELANRNVAG